MIATIIIVSLAYLWLLIESDWLRVRMGDYCEVGACCQYHLPDSAVTPKLRQELINSWPLDKLTKARFVAGLQAPLCGWGYAYQYRNVYPEFKIEVEAWGVRNTCTLIQPDSKLIREIAKSMLRPNKVERKELTKQRKAARLTA